MLKARGLALRGQVAAVPHGNTGKREAPKQELVRAWLQQLHDFECDRPSPAAFIVPDSCLDWKHVYGWFCRDHPEAHVPENYFLSIRKSFFPDMHLRVHDDFAHCDVCGCLRDVIRDEPSPAARHRLQQQLSDHMTTARDERVLMQTMAEEAKHDDVLHVLVDGTKSVYVAVVSAPHLLLLEQGAFKIRARHDFELVAAAGEQKRTVIFVRRQLLINNSPQRPAATAKGAQSADSREPKEDEDEDDVIHMRDVLRDEDDWSPSTARGKSVFVTTRAPSAASSSAAPSDNNLANMSLPPGVGQLAALWFNDDPNPEQRFGIVQCVRVLDDGKHFEAQIWECAPTQRFSGYKPLRTNEGKPYTCIYEPSCQITKFSALESGGFIPQAAQQAIDDFLHNEGLERDEDRERDEELAAQRQKLLKTNEGARSSAATDSSSSGDAEEALEAAAGDVQDAVMSDADSAPSKPATKKRKRGKGANRGKQRAKR